MKSTLYIGLDVHKESIAVSIAHERDTDVNYYGEFSNDLHRLEAFISKMRKQHGAHVELKFAYEAGPTGFVIARRLQQLKISCIVAAPTDIRSGKRKNDRRDSMRLARLLRSGDLTPVYVPEPTDEAIRDLCRCRSDAVGQMNRNRHQLKAFLLRNNYRYTGKANWSAAHMRYLREIVLPHPAHKVIVEEYLMSIDSARQCLERCESQMKALLDRWRLAPAVYALMAYKGFKTIASMIVVSELGNVLRFKHPSALMAYIGLVPGERSSGLSRRLTSITKCGNSHLRYILVECARHYKTPPKVSKELSLRQSDQPQWVRKLSWKTQNRLHARYQNLSKRRLHHQKAVIAVARELTGFIWDLLRRQPCYQLDEQNQVFLEPESIQEQTQQSHEYVLYT